MRRLGGVFRHRSEPTSTPPLAERRQLVVCGDDPDAVEVLVRLMGASGFELTRAARRDDVIEALVAHRGGVVLLSQTHPGGAALEVVTAVRDHDMQAVNETPIIVVTGPGIDEATLADVEIQSVLRKPLHSTVIVDAVRRYMG